MFTEKMLHFTNKYKEKASNIELNMNFFEIERLKEYFLIKHTSVIFIYNLKKYFSVALVMLA